MKSSLLLSITTLIYGLSAFFYIAAFIFRRQIVYLISRSCAIIGVFLISVGIMLRWFESYKIGIGHAPLSNLYESLIFFAWLVMLIYLIIEKRYRTSYIGLLVVPMAFLAIAYASLSPNVDDAIRPLVPALQSNWLIVHVVTCFIGYAAFAISFALSVTYLLKMSKTASSIFVADFLPKNQNIEELNYQMITFGFLFLTLGIVTGSVWANSAWGSYWSWDPKETWSLITWIVYAILLHVRFMSKHSGKKEAYISVIGFMAVLITYFGVNYLHGLHSYAKV